LISNSCENFFQKQSEKQPINGHLNFKEPPVFFWRPPRSLGISNIGKKWRMSSANPTRRILKKSVLIRSCCVQPFLVSLIEFVGNR
jgi:hypothetical protein